MLMLHFPHQARRGWKAFADSLLKNPGQIRTTLWKISLYSLSKVGRCQRIRPPRQAQIAPPWLCTDGDIHPCLWRSLIHFLNCSCLQTNFHNKVTYAVFIIILLLYWFTIYWCGGCSLGKRYIFYQKNHCQLVEQFGFIQPSILNPLLT